MMQLQTMSGTRTKPSQMVFLHSDYLHTYTHALAFGDYLKPEDTLLSTNERFRL